MAGSRNRRRRGGRNGEGRSRPSGGNGARRPRGAARPNGSAGHDGASASRADAPPIAELCELSPFAVFCALHLGITERDGYQEAPLRDVAKRFDLTEEEFAAYLEEHDLSADALRQRDFDLGSAKLDIAVAPEGISRTELARTLFAELEGTGRR